MSIEPPKPDFDSVSKRPRRLDLRLRHLNRTLLSLTMPAVLETSLFSLVALTDTLIVGCCATRATWPSPP